MASITRNKPASSPSPSSSSATSSSSNEPVNLGKVIRTVDVHEKETYIEQQTHKFVCHPGKEVDTLTKLQEYIKQQDEKIGFNRSYNCFPFDGAIALKRVIDERYGSISVFSQQTMFGKIKPQVVSIKVSPDVSEDVIWGTMQFPGIDGEFKAQANIAGSLVQFVLTGEVKRKHVHLANKLADEIEEQLKNGSIYRGQTISLEFPWAKTGAFNLLADQPTFINVSKYNESDLIFGAPTNNKLCIDLYTMIKRLDICKEAGMQGKLGVALEGEYGCGKSLTASVVAKMANDHGWTVLFVKDVMDIEPAILFARTQQPCLLFLEDMDTMIKNLAQRPEGDGEQIFKKVCEMIDGIDAKHTDIIIVYTTNHIEAIPPAMLRPGRTDCIIKLEPPDSETAIKLVTKLTKNFLKSGEDLTELGSMLCGKSPASIVNIVNRATRYFIFRQGRIPGENELLAADLIAAAESFKIDEMVDSKPKEFAHPMEVILKKLLGGIININVQRPPEDPQ